MAGTPTTPESRSPVRKREDRLRREAEARGPTPLGRLASWTAELSAPDFVAGKIVSGRTLPDGAHAPPFWADGKVAMRFLDYCYVDGWVRPEIHWGDWAKTARGKALRTDPATVATADEAELAALLTTIIRADRFTEGYAGTKFKDGTMLAICRRAGGLERAAAGR